MGIYIDVSWYGCRKGQILDTHKQSKCSKNLVRSKQITGFIKAVQTLGDINRNL